MVIIRTQLNRNRQLLLSTQHDTVVNNGDFNSFASSANSWLGNEGRRNMITLFPATIGRLTIDVEINNNTVGGATIRSRVNGAFGNSTITLTDLPARFEDITNTDDLVDGDEFSLLYTFADGTIATNAYSGVMTSS